jgi:hypothetical protein
MEVSEKKYMIENSQIMKATKYKALEIMSEMGVNAYLSPRWKQQLRRRHFGP